MEKTKDLSNLNTYIEGSPTMITLEYIYSKNSLSPISSQKDYEQKYNELLKKLKDILYSKLKGNAILNARDIPLTQIFSISEMIIYAINKSKDIMLSVMKPKYSDDFLACHSLNVAFLSCMVAMGMKLEYKELTEIGVAALLHDIGMTKLDSDCYLKKDSLSYSDRKDIEKHPILGWQFFEKLKSELPWLLRVIIEEHKREQGKGYPEDIQNDLHIYSKIIGLCDSFEALTHERIYRKAFHPADAIKAIIESKEMVFAKNVLRAMLDSLSMFPVGSLVQLNNKKSAIVIQSIFHSPIRPIVMVLSEDNKEEEVIDLSKENNLYITGIIYNDQYQVPKDLKIS